MSDQSPLVICALGGSSAGKELLELGGRSFPIIRQQMPDLHMVVVCGSQLEIESLDLPDGVDARGYVPDL